MSEQMIVDNTDITDCLKDSLALKVVSQIDSGSRGMTEDILIKMDIIQSLIYRFWTVDFIDDLVDNSGSGIFLGSQFVIDFSRNFYSAMSYKSFQRSLADPSVNTFHPTDLINVTMAIVETELASLSADDLEVSKLNPSEAEYLNSLRTKYPNDSELKKFMLVNNWLIPFYMLFATDAWQSFRSMTRSQ